jgi:serine protease Do
MKTFSRSMTGFFAGAVGALVILTLVYFNSWGKDVPPNITVDSTPIVRQTQGITSFAPIVKKVAPSVVNIYSTHIVHQRLNRNPFFGDPLFRQFFGGQMPDNGGREITRKEESLGSGVIVSSDGYILTANHVVAGADQIKVGILKDKKEYTAKVIGTDPMTDVALLKIDAAGLTAITLGDSDQLEVGDIALAIGNPFNVGQTVTMGIISALGRNIPDMGREDRRVHIQDFIQTDAAINPGNSGGALVDAEGRLIGINTAIESSSEGSEGIGFAVPVNITRYVMDSLIRNGGKIEHGYLGVNLEDITPDFQSEFNLPTQNGALVGDVVEGSPADKAGIQAGDALIQIDGKPIDAPHTMQLLVSESAPGTKVTVELLRKGETKTITVTLGQLPGSFETTENSQNNSASTVPDALDGVSVDNLSSDIRAQLRVPSRIHGAIVVSVDQDSNAADAGLHPNDVILEINQQPVTSADDAVKLCNAAKGDRILLRIWRREGGLAMTMFISVDNTKHQDQNQSQGQDQSQNQDQSQQ